MKVLFIILLLPKLSLAWDNPGWLHDPAALQTTYLGFSTACINSGKFGTDRIDGTVIQSRVTGTCTGNNFVQSIAEAGTVGCGAGGAGANLPQTISIGGYNVLTNVGTAYDAVAVSSGMGIAYVNFTGVAAIDWYISITKAGTSNHTYQLFNVTDSAELGTIVHTTTGTAILNTTISSGIPTGNKLVRVRAKAVTGTDDPIYNGSTIQIR
mgnify:CR=1 FL=1